jgi:hypothetical protein
MRHANFFSHSTQVEYDLEVEPVSTGVKFSVAPAVTPVELGEECQPPVVGGIQMPGEFGNLVFELSQWELVINTVY